jgi:hypothetical protein
MQERVLHQDAIDYALNEFENHLKNAFTKLSSQIAQMRERKQKLEGEL